MAGADGVKEAIGKADPDQRQHRAGLFGAQRAQGAGQGVLELALALGGPAHEGIVMALHHGPGGACHQQQGKDQEGALHVISKLSAKRMPMSGRSTTWKGSSLASTAAS